MNRALILIILVSAAVLLSAPSTASASPSPAPANPYISVWSSSPLTNITLAVPLDSTNDTVLPVINVFVSYGQYNISYNGKIMQSGFASSPEVVSFTISGRGDLYFNISKAPGSTPLSFYALNVTVVQSVTAYSFQAVYAVSTLGSNDQFLYASPLVAANATYRVVPIMYPYWNITMYSSQRVSYTIFSNGGYVASGSFVGKHTFLLYINATTSDVVVDLGSVAYRFQGIPIATQPLQKIYAPPAPIPIYTQAYLNLFKVKVDAGVVLIIVASALIVGPVVARRKDRKAIRVD